LTVIIVGRRNARREEDGPVKLRWRGHRGALEPVLPACGCGGSRPAAAPRPVGSRP